jgi:hypothetical protein
LADRTISVLIAAISLSLRAAPRGVVWCSSKVITGAYRKAHERLDNSPWLYIVHDLNPPRDESDGQGLCLAAVLVRRFDPHQRAVK